MITTELRPFAPQPPPSPTWLLPGLLPKGELVLLEGAASVGKSLLAAAVAAKISRDDAGTLLTASPAASETLATHLARQHPNYDRLRELVWAADRDGQDDFAAEEALTKLQNHLDQHQPPLLVIDSLEESFAVLAGEKERKLRAFWSGLVALARHHGTTILVLARPRGRRGIARVARTAAEAARAIFTLAWHPTDPALRVLTRTRDLTAPAGAQWHITLDPDGRVDWTEAAPADHVAPAAVTATWHADTRHRPDLRAAVRAIEDALTGPTLPLVLRKKVMDQGHTLNAFRTAMTLVDAEYKKLGSVWVYSPGPELQIMQELRRRNAATPEVALSKPTESNHIQARLQLYKAAGAKMNAARAAFITEVGPTAAQDFFDSKDPHPMVSRFDQIITQAYHSLTPQEREAFDEMNRVLEEEDARQRQAAPDACCARAHPARS